MGNNIKNLATKMIKIMSDVEFIQKNGFNQFHRYKYATEADVVSAFAKALRNNNVFMFQSILDRSCITYKTRGDKDSFLVTVKMEITFVDADSGESFTSIFYGDGSDSDDKGVYKAITGAQKYALMKTFLVETGDDPERDSGGHENNDKKIQLKTVDKKTEDFLLNSLKDKASEGAESFKKAWASLSDEYKESMRKHMEEFKSIVEKNKGE